MEHIEAPSSLRKRGKSKSTMKLDVDRELSEAIKSRVQSIDPTVRGTHTACIEFVLRDWYAMTGRAGVGKEFYAHVYRDPHWVCLPKSSMKWLKVIGEILGLEIPDNAPEDYIGLLLAVGMSANTYLARLVEKYHCIQTISYDFRAMFYDELAGKTKLTPKGVFQDETKLRGNDEEEGRYGRYKG